MVTSGPSSRSRRRPASGVRTVTELPEARATNSSTVVSAMSRPRPTTISRVAVWAISLIRCDDTNTVRPSAASALSRLRIHSTPSGSRPFTGSSRTTTLGSPSNAEALAHPQGEPADPLAGHLAQPHHVDDLIHAPPADPVGLGQREQVVTGRAARVHGPRLQQQTQLRHRRDGRPVRGPVDPHAAAARLIQPGDQPHRRRLAGPVRPKETRYDPRLHHEVQAVNRELFPVTLTEVSDLDHLRSFICYL